MIISKHWLTIVALLLVSLTLKSQEPEPSWELLLGEATTESDYLPGNLLELKDNSYIIPLISTVDYRETDERACEAKILIISSVGEILDNITIECDEEYKINDISVDIWNDTVNVFLHLIANDHTNSKIMHNYLYEDLSLSEQNEIYHIVFDTLLAPASLNKRGNAPLIDKKGTRTISFGYTSRFNRNNSKYDKDYNVVDKVMFLKFDSRFNVVAEMLYDIEDLHFSFLYPHTLNYNIDSTAYYFMARALNRPWNSQYILDMDLNYLDRISYSCYPQGVYDSFICNWIQSPYDGEMYGFGEVHTPWQDSELFMFKLNPDNMEAEYNVSTNTENSMRNSVLSGENICFLPNGEIYGLGIYDYNEFSDFTYNSNVCYIGVFDKSINNLSEWYYQISPYYNHYFDNIYYTESDDIIITGEIRHKENEVIYYEPYIVKFPASAFDTDNIEEAHAHGLHLAMAYPNPGGDVLNIRTGLRNATLSVYDIQGKMVHQQEITEDVTSIDASGWKSGTYVWELGTENGNGSGILESGKWVK